jgi:hypothetical protein
MQELITGIYFLTYTLKMKTAPSTAKQLGGCQTLINKIWNFKHDMPIRGNTCLTVRFRKGQIIRWFWPKPRQLWITQRENAELIIIIVQNTNLRLDWDWRVINSGSITIQSKRIFNKSTLTLSGWSNFSLFSFWVRCEHSIPRPKSWITSVLSALSSL